MKRTILIALFVLTATTLYARKDQWSGGRISVSDFKKVPHGDGTMIYGNGDKFVGEMDYGERAKGTFTSKNGMSVYRGPFFSDKYDGFGELWENGCYYVGNFDFGNLHGPGTFVDKEGITHSGIFSQGKFIWGYVADKEGKLIGIQQYGE